MFYSHQLLSKKGPLGQIWIAATMKATMNRKKTEQIDIEEICAQILQPQIPLALRLSGILMGGVVLIFHRKVKFLHDDVSELLVKIKAAMNATTNIDQDPTSLPRGKSHARYENVTITYNFSIFDDIEKPLMHPTTPEIGRHDADHDQDMADGNEYVFVGKPGDPQDQARTGFDIDMDEDPHLGPAHLQAHIADITLEDNGASPKDQPGNFMDDERFPATDRTDFDDFFPEMHLPDQILLDSHTAMPEADQGPGHEDLHPRPDSKEDKPKETSIEDGALGPQSPEPGAAIVQKKTRRPRARSYKNTIDDCKEISAKEFESWLQHPEVIVGRKKLRKDSGASILQKLFTRPLSSFPYREERGFDSESDWTEQLTNLWRRALEADSGSESKGRHRDEATRIESVSSSHASGHKLPSNSIGNGRSRSPSDPSHDQAGPGEIYPLASSSSDHPLNPDAPEPGVQQTREIPQVDNVRSTARTNAPLTSVERGQLDYGSVEKLRAVLQTPSSGSEERSWGQRRFTPALSGKFGTRGGGRLDHGPHLFTPGSEGLLPMDVHGEPFTSGSGRFKGRQPPPPALVSGELPANDFFTELDILAPDVIGNADSLRVRREPIASREYEPAERTRHAQLEALQQASMDNVTADVLRCFRQSFDDLGAQSTVLQSLIELSEGMNKSQAAKLFYQTLVLSSNGYLKVSQDEPFGDIVIGRGQNM